MKSINAKVKQLNAMVNTGDFNLFENTFVYSVDERTDGGKDVSMLSEKQIAIIDRIYNKHFAD